MPNRKPTFDNELISGTQHDFAVTPIQRRKQMAERMASFVFLMMTFAMVAPLAVILVYLFVKGMPALTFSFIFENPKDYMRAGGIWAPLIDTFYLVFFSLLAAAPIAF